MKHSMNRFERVRFCVGGASRAPDTALRAAYVGAARCAVDEAAAELHQLEALVAAHEAEMVRLSKVTP